MNRSTTCSHGDGFHQVVNGHEKDVNWKNTKRVQSDVLFTSFSLSTLVLAAPWDLLHQIHLEKSTHRAQGKPALIPHGKLCTPSWGYLQLEEGMFF